MSSRQKPKIVYWNHSPTPYFVERFNAVSDLESMEFEAWFNERREAGRSWDVDETKWRFPARYIPRRSLLGWKASIPVPELRLTRPDLLVQEYDRAPLAAGLLAGRILAGKVALRVLPNYDAWSDRTWWREASKHLLFRSVDGAKVSGADGAALAERYGLASSRIHPVSQSIDVGLYRTARDFDPDERARRRDELGLAGCVFIYVGRLWRGKGLDYLVQAYRALSSAGPPVSLLLVGDGPDEMRYREMTADLPGVVFAGFVQASELPRYYGLADAMVFPTLGDPNGLVVEEAMAAGLPAVVTDAAGDIRRRVHEGETGFVVPSADGDSLAHAMRRVAADPDLRQHLSGAAETRVARFTHEQYARDFEEFVFAVLAGPRRASAAAAVSRGFGVVVNCVLARRRAAPVVNEPNRS